MAILVLYGKNEDDVKHKAAEIQPWVEALLGVDPNLDVRVWPNIGNPGDIEFAISWNNPKIENGSIFSQLPNLKGINSLGAGVNHILKDRPYIGEIPIARIVDPQLTIGMTHYVVGAALNVIKQFDRWQEQQQQTRWDREPPVALTKARVGILGVGKLGLHCANALRHLEITVNGWSRTPKQIDDINCFAGDDELPAFLSKTDILVCLLPLTDATTGILNKELFSYLPDGAHLINVARGPHLNDQDLLDALKTGKLSGAHLDVFHQEPLDAKHPFWNHPKIHLTPHIASVTDPQSVAKQLVDNYYRAVEGKPLNNRVEIDRGY